MPQEECFCLVVSWLFPKNGTSASLREDLPVFCFDVSLATRFNRIFKSFCMVQWQDALPFEALKNTS